MADKAYITAKVFKWARESAKMTEEIAASKVAVSIDKFKEWENGEDYPTIRQEAESHGVFISRTSFIHSRLKLA